jgi:hypothetical protein
MAAVSCCWLQKMLHSLAPFVRMATVVVLVQMAVALAVVVLEVQ